VSARSEGRRALITGITGQDGSFLTELLLGRGYQVIGLVRGPPGSSLGASEHLRDGIEVVRGDLLDSDRLREVVHEVCPDELYHLAAPSFVPDSWTRPAHTLAAIAGSTAALLEAVRDRDGATRVFVASSSLIFGAAPESPQHEETPCRPENPYASAKLAAHHLVGQLRGRDGLFACSGVLYNHESERRPESFVTRKITRAAAAIKLGLADRVDLGDLDAVRDWSFAGDVMHGAWLALQQPSPDDYVLASGISHTVAEFAEIAFAEVGLRATDHIRSDPSLRRGPEPTVLIGDPGRARSRLGWRATVGFEMLIRRMVQADLRELAQAPHLSRK
jgi:GDPmannose 4,6-dehydratase